MDWAAWFDKFSNVVVQLWNFELYQSGNNRVAVSQLVIALLFISVGIWVARKVTSLISKRLRKAQHVGAHTIYFIEKLALYTLFTIVVLVALPIAGIPITIFTVIGGALAIGVGFGAQNLFNNLISGLIIMFERPIRIGDIIELSGFHGRVMDIGARRVRVRRTDGVDVLLPNSSFLEQPVMNWTLSDSMMRGSVKVGVAYGSDTELVRKLMMTVTRAQDEVLEDQEVVVLFEDFGDNALTFDVLFWANVGRPMDLRRIQSSIRFAIDHAFREHQISIAFPQRDVHLDTLRPLEVTIKDPRP